MSAAAYALSKQIEAAKILRDQIADIAAGDPEFVRDVIEGETDLHECIAALIASIVEDERLAQSIKSYQEDLQARRKRIEDRADLKRALVTTAMEAGELRKLEAPAGTVSLKPVPPKVIVSEEADIPSRFWKPAAPTLDRKTLGEELKAREMALRELESIEDPEEMEAARAKVGAEHPPIPGATLSNGSMTISIRSK